MPQTIQPLERFADVTDQYDAFILDLWGVVHNGVKAFPHAIEFMQRAKRSGKQVLLLSNAPRRVSAIQVGLRERLGVADDLYDHFMSSGEDAFYYLRDRPDEFYQTLGHKAWFLGVLPLDASMQEGFDVTFVEDPAEADYCLNIGPQLVTDQPEDWDPQMRIWLEKGVPMVCANPDIVVHHGEHLKICAGAIAARFEALGGTVRYHGKPHASVYQRCFDLLEVKDKRRILAVGDSFSTDVKGANAQGIDCALVSEGIYRDRIKNEGVAAVAEAEGAWPEWVVNGLVW